MSLHEKQSVDAGPSIEHEEEEAGNFRVSPNAV